MSRAAECLCRLFLCVSCTSWGLSVSVQVVTLWGYFASFRRYAHPRTHTSKVLWWWSDLNIEMQVTMTLKCTRVEIGHKDCAPSTAVCVTTVHFSRILHLLKRISIQGCSGFVNASAVRYHARLINERPRAHQAWAHLLKSPSDHTMMNRRIPICKVLTKMWKKWISTWFLSKIRFAECLLQDKEALKAIWACWPIRQSREPLWKHLHPNCYPHENCNKKSRFVFGTKKLGSKRTSSSLKLLQPRNYLKRPRRCSSRAAKRCSQKKCSFSNEPASSKTWTSKR